MQITVATPDGPSGGSRGLARWLTVAAPRGARGEVTVALVSDARMRTLNRTHRGKDYVTDVLSFPTGERPTLGDIVIASGMAARQAEEHGHGLVTECRVLALHGLLHLLGHDHEKDQGEMAALETRLRVRAGLPQGLLGRSTP